MRVFVDHAGELAPPDVQEHTRRVLERVRASRDLELLEFNPIQSDTPHLLAEKVKDNIADCDLFVALCGGQSILLGTHMQRAAVSGKPVALFLPKKEEGRLADREMLEFVASHPDRSITRDFYREPFDLDFIMSVIMNRMNPPYRAAAG